jgi:hypothetical protein
MPLANTSTPVPVLPAMAAWNVALQHMERASSQLAGREAGPAPVIPNGKADLALENVNRIANVDQYSHLQVGGTLPAVRTSGAGSDVTAAVRVLQDGNFSGGTDIWLANNAKTAVDLLAQASGKLAVAPDAQAISTARSLIDQAANAYGLE